MPKTIIRYPPVRRIYSKHCPEYSFVFSFLDESLDDLYRTDRRIGSIFNVFTTWQYLSHVWACLGWRLFLSSGERKRSVLASELRLPDNIKVWTFALAAAFALGIALLTIS